MCKKIDNPNLIWIGWELIERVVDNGWMRAEPLLFVFRPILSVLHMILNRFFFISILFFFFLGTNSISHRGPPTAQSTVGGGGGHLRKKADRVNGGGTEVGGATAWGPGERAAAAGRTAHGKGAWTVGVWSHAPMFFWFFIVCCFLLCKINVKKR